MTNRCAYEFVVDPGVPMADVQEAIDLALLAVAATDGYPRIQLDVRYAFDERTRTVQIDASTNAGQRAAQILAGLLEAAHGAGAFSAERIEGECIT